jgi:hypothetical protein
MRNGPLTSRGLATDAERSTAWARYHLRVLCTTDAVRPFLTGMAQGDEAAYRLTPENLPAAEQEILLGELSLQTCGQLMEHMLGSEEPLTAAELAERTGICPREVARYLRTLRGDGAAPRAEAGNKPDRLRDLPEWFLRWRD